MARRKAVPILRTRRKGEKPRPDEHGRWSGEDFAAHLALLNREGVTDWDGRGRRLNP